MDSEQQTRLALSSHDCKEKKRKKRLREKERHANDREEKGAYEQNQIRRPQDFSSRFCPPAVAFGCVCVQLLAFVCFELVVVIRC